jgi:predicted nucleic acid-binding protein
MIKALLDSDVILDFFFDRRPFSTAAAGVIALCEAKTIEGFITPVICSNVYYLLRKTAKHEKVIEKLSALLHIVDVLQTDRKVVLQALSSGFNDFEDAIQSFSAVNSGFIDVIVTRNVKDYKKSEIGAMTPSDFLSTME